MLALEINDIRQEKEIK